jgi:hypothetical protein
MHWPKKRELWVIAVVLVTLLGNGCKRKKNLDGRLDDLEQLVGETCACKMEPGCLKYQERAYIAWSMRNDSTDAVRATPNQRDRAGRLYMEMNACLGRGPGSTGSNR